MKIVTNKIMYSGISRWEESLLKLYFDEVPLYTILKQFGKQLKKVEISWLEDDLMPNKGTVDNELQ